MKCLTLPGIDEYVLENTSPETPYLSEIVSSTEKDFQAPQMILGVPGARLLQAFIHTIKPQTVLEIGTFVGYSSISMAAAMPSGARLITCEANPRHARAARKNMDATPYGAIISIEEGPALDTIARLPGPFDLVFMDADKTEYPQYLKAVLPKLSPRGLIIADNTLWNGEVMDATTADADAQALRAFNRDVANDPTLTTVLLSVRDGLTLIWPAAYRW